MVGKITPDHMASASIVPSILGINPYQSQNDVLRSCINASHGMKRKPLADPRRADFGNAIEPFLAKMACDAVGGHSLKTEFPDPFFHDELELAASLDATCVGIARIHDDPSKGIHVMTGEGYIDIKGTGAGGMYECAEPGAEKTRYPIAAGFEHGPFFDIDNETGQPVMLPSGAVFYPRHGWEAGTDDDPRQSYDLVFAFETLPSMVKIG